MAGCPFHTTDAQAALSDDFDAFTFMADPHALLARARNEAPVFYDEATEHWVVTSYEAIKQILAAPKVFSSSNALDPMFPFDPEVPQILEAGEFGARPFILNIDGEEHSEHKRIMSKVLHPRAVADREDFIRELAYRLISNFPDEPFDFVQKLSLELPALVIFDFLGLPDHVVHDVKRWADARMELFFGELPLERQADEARGMVEFWRFIEAHIDEQLKDPGDHFVGDLIRLFQSGEESITRNDIANYCWSFLFAGHETTTSQLTNMVKDLMTQRDVWEALVADPGLINPVVEESLRMNTSVFNLRRRTTEEVTVDGVTLPEGANVFVVSGGANRDDSVFNDPDRYVPGRENIRRHLGFGFGEHFCGGAGLARLQLRVVLRELIAEVPDLQLVPGAERRYIDNAFFCAPRTLWLTRSGGSETPATKEA